MLLGLNFDNSNPYTSLLEEIFNIIDSRRIQQIIASNGIKPLDKFNFSLKVQAKSVPLGKLNALRPQSKRIPDGPSEQHTAGTL